MATKQKVETSEVKEEGKKITTKKSSSTKSTTAKKSTTANKSTPKKEEVPAVEEKVEAVPEVEVVGKKVVEVISEEPKPVEVKEEKKPEPKKEVQKSFQVQVAVPAGSYLFKGPGLQFPKGKLYAKGTKLEVTEVQGNWGKVLGNSWILLNTVNKL